MSTTLRAAIVQLKPAADTANDAQFVDVIGIKADTVAGTSLVALSKFIKARERQITTRASDALPATAAENIFTITGKVRLIQLIGVITVEMAADQGNLKVDHTGLIGTATALASNVAMASAAVGTTLTIATLGGALVKTVNVPVAVQANQIVLTSGSVSIETSATKAGSVRWIMIWEPIDADATVVATAI